MKRPTEIVTREGAGAEERAPSREARRLCEYFAGEEHGEIDCPGCLTAQDALDAASSAATEKERERTGRPKEMLAAVIAETWAVLRGGDDPRDRCPDCGLAGVGELRYTLKKAETLLARGDEQEGGR